MATNEEKFAAYLREEVERIGEVIEDSLEDVDEDNTEEDLGIDTMRGDQADFQRILGLLEAGGTLEQAVREVGLLDTDVRDTLFEYMPQDAELRAAVDEILTVIDEEAAARIEEYRRQGVVLFDESELDF